jgi:hypothetical protein
MTRLGSASYSGKKIGFTDSLSARISPKASPAAGVVPSLPARRNTFLLRTLAFPAHLTSKLEQAGSTRIIQLVKALDEFQGL